MFHKLNFGFLKSFEVEFPNPTNLLFFITSILYCFVFVEMFLFKSSNQVALSNNYYGRVAKFMEDGPQFHKSRLKKKHWNNRFALNSML